MRRAPHALAAALALLLVTACSGPPPLEPHVRLAAALGAERGLREPPVATIAGRTHYVLNDVGPRALDPVSGDSTIHLVTADDEGGITIAGLCPGPWLGHTVLADAVVTPLPMEREDEAPALEMRALRPHELTRCPEDDREPLQIVVAGLEPGRRYALTRFTGMVLPPSQTEIPWIELPPRAVFRVALGVRRSGTVEANAMRFRVRAENPDGSEAEVADWTVPVSEHDERGGWTDVEASLDPVRRRLGEKVRLILETTPWQGEAGILIPFWGAPAIFAPRSEPRSRSERNVVLVSLDTLRADRLGTYGYPLPITPHLDRFAAEGATMEQATAPANWTLPSHASMLTGLHPCAHGVRGQLGTRSSQRFAPEIVPLAEILRRRGYRTAAFTENAFVDVYPFQRGFGRFDADTALDGVLTAGLIETTFEKALGWMTEARRGGPFFVFVHTYQVHEPYTPPPADLAEIPSPLPLPPGGLPPTSDDQDAARAYVAEVAFTDRVVGRFLAELEALGIADQTVVVVTSDHGEAFGEHGVRRHGHGLYEEELWIPMLWRAPGLIAAGQRLSGLTTLADIPPTILALLGEKVPDWMQGLSLANALAGGAGEFIPQGRILPLEGFLGLRGIRGQSWKLLVAPLGQHRGQLLHLGRDPGERMPSSAPAELVRRQEERLERECERTRELLAAASPGPWGPSELPPLDPERDQKLRALGYLD